MDLLQQVKNEYDLNRKHSSDLFQGTGFVFTDDFGNRITPQALYRAFKLEVLESGMPIVIFHGLRCAYEGKCKENKKIPGFVRTQGKSNGRG